MSCDPAPSYPLIPAIPIEHEPYGYATEWLIPSKSEGGADYLVDLAANKGHGSCQCRWYQTSYLPLLKRGQVPPRVCSHISEARRRFTVWAVNEFEKHNPNKNDPE